MALPSKLVRAALSQPILEMVAKVYIPVLFPLTFAIAMAALWMDSWVGGLVPLSTESGFLPEPANLWIGAFALGLGALLWIWTYQQLSVMGEGSPSPTAGRTRRLVVRGIYAYSRNPSLFGKLLGVLAVGFWLNSFSFCFILVPALLTGSLIEKVWRQEPQLIEVFGDDYLRYRDTVPLFLPWGLIFPTRRFPTNGAS